MDKEQTGVKKQTKKIGASTGRKGRVLVMDDDAFVRGVIRGILAEAGYDIRATKNGVEAIGSFKEAKDLGRPFDIVILDLHVPSGMGGDETMGFLRHLDPEVRAILLTADINHPAVVHYETLGFKAVIIKPFTRDDLLQALDRASDAGRDSVEASPEV